MANIVAKGAQLCISNPEFCKKMTKKSSIGIANKLPIVKGVSGLLSYGHKKSRKTRRKSRKTRRKSRKTRRKSRKTRRKSRKLLRHS